MAAFFSLTLAVSIVGLVTLLVLKRYEMSTSRVVLWRLRPALGHFFHRMLVFVERGLPSAVRTFILGTVRKHVRTFAAHAMVFFEHNLERMLHLVRQKSQEPRGEGVTSQFLQEVAAHKQKLLRRAPSKRMILDE
ncbi:MAG: hypothetical protein Q8P58_01080 [Candidatus Adlerbacteria bacterium]|nr:hypothetical protein [Candidatus Adlerbacteria bacterium]MDZ4226089.1 hypothetical protein [Patescibacteria group bacterium]